MIHSFLLVGQSNMAGRGFLRDVPPIYDEHINMLRNGRWQTMQEPIHNDRPFAGVGLAASFAAAWRVENDHEQIGLIPCADGGTSLDDWAVGGTLYDHAVFQTKLALRSSRLAGILWHQGESDSFANRASAYYEKFFRIVEAFRRDLNSPTIPLMIGGLGDYLVGGLYGAHLTEYPQVNQVLLEFARTVPYCYFVAASGLTANPDGIHLDALSQRLFGIRYFDAFHRRQHIVAPLADETNRLTRIINKPLSKTEKTALLANRFAGGELAREDFEAQLATLNDE